MKHRGHDDDGSVFTDGWNIGRQRLAILDTSERANQPIKKRGNYLAVNCEIYNYLELRKKYSPIQSTESRALFLNYRVIEFIRKLLLDYIIDKSVGKAPLRHILKKYGKEYIYKNARKTGFTIDVTRLTQQPNTRRFLLKNLRSFSLGEYEENFQKYREMISKSNISWDDAISAWKYVGINITSKVYEK